MRLNTNQKIAMITPAIAALVSFWMVPQALAVNNQIQVVFSGNAFGNFGGHPGNANFHIWCKLTPGPNANAYGIDCAGSMSFPSLGITREVEETDSGIQNLGAGVLQMHVQSMVDSAVNCFLTNTPPVTAGPTNGVNVNCIAPSGTGSTHTATVAVTGP